MRIKNYSNTPKKITILVVVIVLVCSLVGYSLYAYLENTWPFTRSIPSETQNSTKNSDSTSSVGTDVENYIKDSGGSQSDSSTQAGGVVDTGGKNVTQSNGISSSSGDITLYSPVVNQKVSGQVTVSGSAKVSEVFYRINDDVNGMIGSGRLTVHSGYFSGNLTVSTKASTGSFEVYSFNSQGQEINNISISIKY